MTNLNQQLIAFLDSHHLEYRYFEHEPTLTSLDSARVRGTTLDQGAKALLFLADGKPLLAVMSSSTKLDSHAFKKAYGFKDLKMATPEQVETITGALPGAVPPFGNLFNVPVYVDAGLLKNAQIAFNAGLRTASVIMKSSDYIILVKPIIGNYAQLSCS